jgi:uncharacterized protein YbjT (DUF2867 family)
MKRILVTGATGRTGRHVVSQLLAGGTGVRALARNPEAAALPPQVEVVRGDLTLPETLDEALDGIEAVFLVWSAPADGLSAALERIAKHARRVVFLSSPYQTQHPLFQAAQPNPIAALHAQIERSIQASGLAWTFLRPGMIAANALWWWAPQIRAGDVVRWPYALAPTAPIDERDIAAVAVRALSDGRCAGTEYMLTGPQSLSQLEQVSTIGDVLGRSLRYEEILADDWRRELSPTEPLSIANMLLAAWAAAIGQPALVTSDVADVTGKPPRTFREWATDHAAEFQLKERGPYSS